jgi:hypothetical protein
MSGVVLWQLMVVTAGFHALNTRPTAGTGHENMKAYVIKLTAVSKATGAPVPSPMLYAGRMYALYEGLTGMMYW